MVNEDLKAKIREELREDLDRYDGDYDAWSDVVLDCPSTDLHHLMSQGETEDELEEIGRFVHRTVREMDPQS